MSRGVVLTDHAFDEVARIRGASAAGLREGLHDLADSQRIQRSGGGGQAFFEFDPCRTVPFQRVGDIAEVVSEVDGDAGWRCEGVVGHCGIPQ